MYTILCFSPVSVKSIMLAYIWPHNILLYKPILYGYKNLIYSLLLFYIRRVLNNSLEEFSSKTNKVVTTYNLLIYEMLLSLK